MIDPIRIYSRPDGSDMIWTLVIGGKRTKELSRDDICDLLDQMMSYIREDGRDDMLLKTISGPVVLNRSRVYQFGMEAISVMGHI